MMGWVRHSEPQQPRCAQDHVQSLAFTLRLKSMEVVEESDDMKCIQMDKGNCYLNGEQKL